MDRCGVCGDEFGTVKEYLDHFCRLTGFTPADKNHNKKVEEILKTHPEKIWRPKPGPRARFPPKSSMPKVTASLETRALIRALPLKEVPVSKRKLSRKERRKVKKARKELYGKEGRRAK